MFSKIVTETKSQDVELIKITNTDITILKEHQKHFPLDIDISGFTLAIILATFASTVLHLVFIRLVWKHYKANSLDDIIDKKIYDESVSDEIIHVMLIGLQCTQADPHSRPTMSRAVEMLRSNRREEDFMLGDPPFLDVSPMEDLEQGESSRLISTGVSDSSITGR